MHLATGGCQGLPLVPSTILSVSLSPSFLQLFYLFIFPFICHLFIYTISDLLPQTCQKDSRLQNCSAIEILLKPFHLRQVPVRSVASNSMNITFCDCIFTQFIPQGGTRSQAELPLKCNFSSTFSTLLIVVWSPALLAAATHPLIPSLGRRCTWSGRGLSLLCSSGTRRVCVAACCMLQAATLPCCQSCHNSNLVERAAL